ncbi:carbohydrate binding domain-containing protein [candidate division KSB1 bacterium]|nr:carbohydrate binding domain-containing protein [candidate division KSB1 bacterium]
MKSINNTTHYISVLFVLVLLLYCTGLAAQTRHLIWVDEFDEMIIDPGRWNFETGPTYETLHYFTDRPDNAKIVDGKLQIIALEESYQGFNYTAALLKTQNLFYWRYGRIEARIKLPHTTGFVPGFWMLPQGDQYGYWPWSGEIDVMEHPTNQDRIFGTCHSWQYSYFTGSFAPAGGSIQITDSETAFHVYAVEWTADKIDFFVDDQKYFTFNNEHSGFEAWPFDQPFYILLAMGVGGGWVGNPDATSVFPAIMEVDYVRVYQNTDDLVINGDDDVLENSKNIVYTVPHIDGALYSWNVPNGATIMTGENTHQISVDWGIFGGNVMADVTTGDGTSVIEYPVTVSPNLMKNAGFEKGAKYWNKTGPYPAEATFALTTDDVHNGNYAMVVDVKTPGVNAWDAQLSQGNLLLKTGKNYHASFWAKKDGAPTELGPAIINATDYTLYALETITLTDTWQQFEFNFTVPANVTTSFNFGMGGQTGTFYYDDFVLTAPDAQQSNQVMNADFSSGIDAWIFNTFSPANARAAVENGELVVSIINGGVNTWDVHVGQAGVTIEKGKEYTVTFDAYAAAPRDIFAFVGKNATPWNVYSNNNTLSLSTKRQTYSYSFTMNDPTDNAARLGFDIGSASDDVVFDNVFLSAGAWPAAVTTQTDNTPRSFSLFQNSPNPFNPSTVITYQLPMISNVNLSVYNLKGQLVRTLIKAKQDAGYHFIEWDGADESGAVVSSGLYLYRLHAGDNIQTRRMLFLK